MWQWQQVITQPVQKLPEMPKARHLFGILGISSDCTKGAKCVPQL